MTLFAIILTISITVLLLFGLPPLFNYLRSPKASYAGAGEATLETTLITDGTTFYKDNRPLDLHDPRYFIGVVRGISMQERGFYHNERFLADRTNSTPYPGDVFVVFLPKGHTYGHGYLLREVVTLNDDSVTVGSYTTDPTTHRRNQVTQEISYDTLHAKVTHHFSTPTAKALRAGV